MAGAVYEVEYKTLAVWDILTCDIPRATRVLVTLQNYDTKTILGYCVFPLFQVGGRDGSTHAAVVPGFRGVHLTAPSHLRHLITSPPRHLNRLVAMLPSPPHDLTHLTLLTTKPKPNQHDNVMRTTSSDYHPTSPPHDLTHLTHLTIKPARQRDANDVV